MSDTSDAVEQWYLVRLSALTPAERMSQVLDMIDMGFALEESGLRAREPHLSTQEVRMRIAEQRFGKTVAMKIAAAGGK